MKRKSLSAGMTLIELTVVIVVLLTLISVLFFVGTAYIKASNRTSCLVNQEHLQKAMRGYQSLNQIPAGHSFKWSDLEVDGYVGAALNFRCPSNGTKYITADDAVIPDQGVRVAPCIDSTYKDEHVPQELANW